MSRPPRTRHVRPGHQSRTDVVEDVADLLEADPGYTIEGLAMRLGRTTDSMMQALRRAARDGDELAIAVRRKLPVRKDIAA